MIEKKIKIIGHEKRIGLRASSIQPKLNDRKSNPATISSKPRTMPFDRGE
jgi:hypothetical protein